MPPTVPMVIDALNLDGNAIRVAVPGVSEVPSAIATTGKNITTGGTTAYSLIPPNVHGVPPSRIRIAATAAAYVTLGAASDMSAVPSAAGTGYGVGDTITLTGGTAAHKMVLSVATVKIISAAVNAAGTGYANADTITLTGGTHTTAGILAVASTKVVSATIAAAGTGGTPGAATVTGTTGTGTKFQAAVTISAGGVITSVNSISVAGNYTADPSDITQEPVTGASLVGAKLAIVLGVLTVTVSDAGVYSVAPSSFTQASTSGSGTGATFNTIVYGVKTVTVANPGDYTVEPSNPVSQGSSSGSGTGATFTVTWAPAAVAGDILVQPGDAVIVDAADALRVAAIQVTGAGLVNIVALDW
jgi:hypothetical protein